MDELEALVPRRASRSATRCSRPATCFSRPAMTASRAAHPRQAGSLMPSFYRPTPRNDSPARKTRWAVTKKQRGGYPPRLTGLKQKGVFHASAANGVHDDVRTLKAVGKEVLARNTDLLADKEPLGAEENLCCTNGDVTLSHRHRDGFQWQKRRKRLRGKEGNSTGHAAAEWQANGDGSSYRPSGCAGFAGGRRREVKVEECVQDVAQRRGDVGGARGARGGSCWS